MVQRSKRGLHPSDAEAMQRETKEYRQRVQLWLNPIKRRTTMRNLRR